MLLATFAITSQAQLPLEINVDKVAEALKEGSCACKYAHVNQDWLVGSGYAIPGFDRKVLDKDFPDTPVMVRGGAGHAIYLNSEAMKRSGYDITSEPDGQGTCFIRDAEGHLTGEMAEMSMSKGILAVPKAPASHSTRIMKEAQRMLHAAGVTSVQEASANSLFLKAAQDLESSSDLKLELFPHIVYAPDWIGEESTDSLHALLDDAETYRSKHIDTRFVKIILDGVPLPPYYSHAALQDDGKVEEHKLFITNVHDAVRKYDERGMTVKIHATGNGATRLTLDAFEAARKQNPDGPRHEVAHCSGVHDADYHRFKELNVTAEMSPAFFFVHPVTASSNGLMDWNFARMKKEGAHATIGSDWGAGSSPDILPCLQGILEAAGEGDTVRGSERVLRMLTLAGAEAVGRDKELGSISVGKRANFIAVDKDLSKGQFDDAKVMRTWFEGEVVYERP
jgi:predicted amidohydrolase YtcJ